VMPVVKHAAAQLVIELIVILAETFFYRSGKDGL